MRRILSLSLAVIAASWAAVSFGAYNQTPTGLSSGSMVYAPPFTGGVNSTAAAIFARRLRGEDFGLRQGGSTDDSRTGAMPAASNLLTLSAVGDFLLGDDARIEGAGPSYAAGAPSGLAASQQGATGAVSCVYTVSVDDGAGGLSAGVSVTVANANAAQTVDNPVALSYTPPINHLPGAVWKNCAGAGDVWVGAAQPAWQVNITAGSGYTPGAYAFTATGGGCTVEPQGVLIVNNDGTLMAGQTDQWSLGSRIEQAYQGSGCTSAPTVAIPGGAGAGAAGAITLAMIANFQDGGMVPNWLPEYVPATHPTVSQADWIVGTIGALSGTGATICAAGTGTGGVVCTPLTATNTITSSSVRHSWTRDIQNALNAANPNNNFTGISAVALPCGTFELERGSLSIPFGYTALMGAGPNYCTEFLDSGIGPTVSVGANIEDSVRNIYFEGKNTTGGVNAYAVSELRGGRFIFNHILAQHEPGILQLLGVNGAVASESLQNLDQWGDGYADWDFESTFANQTLTINVSNLYSNDRGRKSGARTSRTNRAGFRLNDMATFHASGETALSNVEGHAWELIGTTGNAYTTGQGGHAGGNAFFYGYGVETEASATDEFYVRACGSACEVYAGSANGSIAGHEINVFPWQRLDWFGGKINGAWLANAVLAGQGNTIVGAEVSFGGLSSVGTLPGIEVTGSCMGCRVIDNFSESIEASNPAKQIYPVILDAPIGPLAANGSFTNGSASITMNVVNPGTVVQGMTVFDQTTGHVLGTVASYAQKQLLLLFNSGHPAFGSGGATDALTFYGGNNEVSANNIGWNVNNYVLDSSTLGTNVIGPNPGEASLLPTPSGSCAITAAAGGTVPAQTRGINVGKFTASGACGGGTVILTFATAQPNGWTCDAHDQTTVADLMNETASTASSVTFTGTMANNDVVSYKCVGF